MKFDSWNEYNKNTANNPPRKLCQEAVKLVNNKDQALDAGAGALNDTKYLLDLGFEVAAIDFNPDVIAIAKKINNPKLFARVANLEEYHPPKNTYNFVNAMFTLPFIKPKNFKFVFKGLYESLVSGGIMAFQLFGDKDQWAETAEEDRFHKSMTFLNSEQVAKLLEDKIVIKNEEVIQETKLAVGGFRKSHEFRVILKK